MLPRTAIEEVHRGQVADQAKFGCPRSRAFCGPRKPRTPTSGVLFTIHPPSLGTLVSRLFP